MNGWMLKLTTSIDQITYFGNLHFSWTLGNNQEHLAQFWQLAENGRWEFLWAHRLVLLQVNMRVHTALGKDLAAYGRLEHKGGTFYSKMAGSNYRESTPYYIF